jgi:phenol 2-monooxygenase (NADPH)
MNVSMQDTYNLGWKLASVIKGLAQRSILKTYEFERRNVAKNLIEFDSKVSRLFSRKLAKDGTGVNDQNSEELKQAYKKGNLFALGFAVDYGPSILVAQRKVSVMNEDGNGNGFHGGANRSGHADLAAKQELALYIPLGERFPSFQVLNQSDGRSWQFGKLLPSDGRFRVILFAGNVLDQQQWQRVVKFGEEVARPTSFLRRFTLPGKPSDSVIELLTIHSAPRKEFELADLPTVFHPFDEKRGWDYEKVFVDDRCIYNGHGEAYQGYGVDRERGCVVIARPDQHVAWIGELEDVHEVDFYFSQFLIPLNEQHGTMIANGSAA